MSPILPVPASPLPSSSTIAICGGGIGGLATALALRQAGFTPVAFERQQPQQLREEGLFLTLAPNGCNALRALGLSEKVMAAGLSTRALAIFNEAGKRLALVDYADHAASYGAGSITLRRGALAGLLLDAVLEAGITIHHGAGIEDITQDADGVVLTVRGETPRFALALACDGLRSPVRRRIFPDLPQPRYSGLIGTGGFTEAPGVPDTDGVMNMVFGRRGFFGYIKRDGGPVYWFNSYPAPESETCLVTDAAAYAGKLAAMHAGDPLDTMAILAATPRIDRHYPIYDMPELPRWSAGRVLLMGDVAHAVRDWQPMLERLRRAAKDLERTKGPQRDEALAFVDWLIEHNFTFLGLRQYGVEGEKLAPVPGSGLGILRDPDVRVLRSGADYVETTPQHSAFMTSDEPLLVTKANVRARVHRRAHMDYVGIKLFGEDGRATGELRIVGLFTAQAQATPHTEVPIIRRKIAEVMRKSGVDPLGHDGRTLLSALDSYPRDELFQIGTEQLFEFAGAIAGLYDRPRVRVLPRIDRFDNFVSILVYVPRDRYDGEARARITRYLAQSYDGRVSAYYPHFPEGELVRLHVIIGRVAGPTPQPSRSELEARVDALTSNFGDMLLATAEDPATISDYRGAFSAAYQSRNSAADAHEDIAVLRGLGDGAGVAIRLRERKGADGSLGLKFYHRESAIPLSDRVPMLEAFGFRVIDERTYTVVPRDGVERYLHDMVLEPADGGAFDTAARGDAVEAGLLAVWDGLAESDQLNTLVSRTELSWTDAALLRALSRYLRQVGISYSQRYIAAVLVKQAEAASALVALFNALHDPDEPDREVAAEAARGRIVAALDAMASLDEDTIVRRFQNLVESSVRTNAFQRDENGGRMPALAIKFDSAKVDGMAAPRPYREISV